MKKIMAVTFMLMAGTLVFAKDSMLEAGKKLSKRVFDNVEVESVTYFTKVDDEIEELIEEIIECRDSTKLKAIYEMKINEERINKQCSERGITNKRYLDALKINTPLALIQSASEKKYGMAVYPMFGLFSEGNTFIATDKDPSKKNYIYCYEDMYPVLINFVPGEDNTVSAGAQLIFGLTMDDIQSIDFDDCYFFEEVKFQE